MCTEQEEEVGGGKEQPRQGEEQKSRHSRTEPRKLGTVLSPAWGMAWRGGRGGWKAGAGLEERVLRAGPWLGSLTPSVYGGWSTVGDYERSANLADGGGEREWRENKPAGGHH